MARTALRSARPPDVACVGHRSPRFHDDDRDVRRADSPELGSGPVTKLPLSMRGGGDVLGPAEVPNRRKKATGETSTKALDAPEGRSTIDVAVGDGRPSALEQGSRDRGRDRRA